MSWDPRISLGLGFRVGGSAGFSKQTYRPYMPRINPSYSHHSPTSEVPLTLGVRQYLWKGFPRTTPDVGAEVLPAPGVLDVTGKLCLHSLGSRVQLLLVVTSLPRPLKGSKKSNPPQYELITTLGKLEGYYRVPFLDPLGGLGRGFLHGARMRCHD